MATNAFLDEVHINHGRLHDRIAADGGNPARATTAAGTNETPGAALDQA